MVASMKLVQHDEALRLDTALAGVSHAPRDRGVDCVLQLFAVEDYERVAAA
jgi:hypothetical protein